MIIPEANFIRGATIADVWREAICLCVKNGWDFVVKGGSYAGQIRKQLTHFMAVIEQPSTRPLSPIMPPGLPAPTTDEKIEKYFLRYVAGEELAENEQYTYGSFIVPQLPKIIEILRLAKGNTNQASICIGDKNSVNLPDPPCLRVMSFKVVEGRLNLSVFFRSWDLLAGFPENLGGFQMLKELVLAEISDLGFQDGALIAHSDGLHLYEQYFELVDLLSLEKIKIDHRAVKDKETFDPDKIA